MKRKGIKVGAAALGLLALVGGAAAAVNGSDEPQPVAVDRTTDQYIDGLPVVEFSGDYTTYVESLPELAQKGVVVVKATAGDRTFEENVEAGLMYTHQQFETEETYFGNVGTSFSVFLVGGVIDATNGTYLSQDPENPQFEQGKSYFLVLTPRDEASASYFTVGASQGRYELVNNVLDAVAAAEDFRIESILDGATIQKAKEMIAQARGK